MMMMGGEVAVTASTHNGTAWQALPQVLSPNASLLLISSAIKFRASIPNCNRALATLEYRSAAPVSPIVDEIARITVIVNDMGNYGCYNDCSTAEPVPLLAISTIVIVNYGWFSHKWLLLRPGVLLGVATGLGMLLIFMASVFAWLYLVNRLLSVRGKAQKNQLTHSFMTSLKTRWNILFAKFSKPEDFGPQKPTISSSGVADWGMLEDEDQKAHSATETADDGHTQDEGQGNSDLEYVMYDTIDTYAKDRVPEDGVAADPHVDCCSQGMTAASGASDVISGDGIHDCAQFDVVRAANEALDVISRDSIQDYAQADYPVSGVWQCPPSEAIHASDLAGHVQSTDSLENNCPASDAMEAIYDPFSGSNFQGSNTGGDLQVTNKADTLVDHDIDGYSLPGNLTADGHTLQSNCQSTITVEGPLEGIGYCGSDGYTLPGHLPPAAAKQSLPTNELANTSMTYQIDGMSYFLPCELDYSVDKEGMQHLGYSMVSSVPLEEESPERSRSFSANQENFMPASVSSSFIDNRLNQQHVEDNQACNDGESRSLEHNGNKADYQSSAVKLEAADRSQNEYPNQLNHERVVINDLLSSMPFGDSSSSNQSCTSTEEGNANPIGPMIGMHGKLEVDRMCAFSTNTGDPSIHSHMSELFEEEMLQMPELKLVLELPEASCLDEDKDLLDHINLVFSSLETNADGSLVAVLSQSI